MHWLEELLHTYGQLKVAGEANNLDDNRKILAIDRAVVESHHRRHLGEAFHPLRADSEDDMIHIGDRHDHHHPAGASSRGQLLKWVAVLALLGTGAGGGVGTLVLLNRLLDSAPPVPAAASDSDQDTMFELRLGPPRHR